MDYLLSARRLRALLGVAGALITATALCAPAQAAEGSTSCRASAERVTAVGQVAHEPVLANSQNNPCTTQSAETLHPTTITPVSADAAEAYTSSDARSESALAGVSNPRIGDPSGLSGLPALVSAGTIQASAEATCDSDDNPQLTSSSIVEGLRVAGVPVDITPDNSPQSLDLPGGGTLAVNQTTQANGEVVRRALVVSLPGLADVVIGEARASLDHTTCVGNSGNGNPGNGDGGNGGAGGNGGTGGTGGGGLGRVCPKGSILDTAHAVCVIDDGTRVIVVGRPFEGPSGGTVVALDKARRDPRLKNSPCVKGKGPKYVVVGTGGANHVTGTNRGDRIVVLAGRDRVDGGRGPDCIDGGSGRDKLAGGLGNDRVFGGTGNDHMLGGSGNDRLSGGRGRDLMTGDTGGDRMAGGAGNDRELAGPGNDRVSGQGGNDVLSAGYGRDRVAGGAGRDLLLVNVFGPAARRIDGGSGRDTARFNPKERRRVHHVEHKELIA